MRKYQRGVLVALFGFIATTLVKLFGTHSKTDKVNGFNELFPPDFK